MPYNSQKFENPFPEMNDIDLVRIYDEYEEWNKTGVIRDGSGLATLREQYLKEHGTTFMIALEHDFLLECTKRFYSDFVYGE